MSNYLENAILDHILKVAPYAVPTTLYIGLYTVAPTDAGGGTQVSGGDYARLSIAFDAAVAGASLNSALLQWSIASADWGEVVAFGVFDAISGGNLLYWGAVTPRTVSAGDQAGFNAGQLTISQD